MDAALEKHLKSINATLDPHEQLKCLVVATTAWTVENDIVTPAFKVKRNRIEDVYAANYERWEDSGQSVIWQGS
jgi:long-chain acyl-CoA synthetase